MMEGIAILRLLNRGEDKKGERYILTQPNMYARGILFGKMKYELGDHSFVRCPELGLSADIEFKTKGYFGGTYNAIGGLIKNDVTGEILYELSGMWTGEMIITDKKVRMRWNLRGFSNLLIDREKRHSFQCYEVKTYCPNRTTFRRTGRTRVSEAVVQDRASGFSIEPCSCNG